MAVKAILGSLPPIIVGVSVGVKVGEAVSVGLGVEVGVNVGVLDGSIGVTGDEVCAGEASPFVGNTTGAAVQAVIINKIISAKNDLFIIDLP